jgi:hypothetical protein
MNSENSQYPEKDFPWTFYFNGEAMPKWAACWSMAGVGSFVHPEKDACEDVSERDIYIIVCTIDHIGVESADPDIFLYAVQEVLYLLLYHSDRILASISEHPRGANSAREIFTGLVEGAFRMRQLVHDQRCAFWTSGYEANNEGLKESMRRAALPPASPDYAPPPHLARMRSMARFYQEQQISRLHRLAQSGRFDKATRKRLNELRMD